MKNLSRQSGFVPIAAVVVLLGLALVGLFIVWPKVGGLEGIKDKISGVTPTPTPPPNCRYEEVVCAKAPCPPVLMCDDSEDKIDETANWNTYFSPCDFSIQYPKDYILSGGKDCNQNSEFQLATLLSPITSDDLRDGDSLRIAIFIDKSSKYTSLQDKAKGLGSSWEEVKFNTTLGLKKKPKQGGKDVDNKYVTGALLYKNNSHIYFEVRAKSDFLPVWEKILSTFRFN